MDKQFGERLRGIRELRGIKQVELAAMVRTDPAVVSHWEKGNRKPSITTIRDLCRALVVSSDYLLGLSENPLP